MLARLRQFKKVNGFCNYLAQPALQFDKSVLSDFGELPQGQIPQALKYSRQNTLQKLDNGIKICTEKWQSSIATLTFTVNAGTRYENLEISGATAFIEALSFKGTRNRSAKEVQDQLQNLGGQYQVKSGRELTTFQISVTKENLAQAFELLSDIIQNTTFTEAQVNAERNNIYQQSIKNTQDQYANTLEMVHATSFRDHYISQPLLGVRENSQVIKASDIEAFHHNGYTGENIVVSATGNVTHDDIVKMTEKHFKNINRETTGRQNLEKPLFTSSVLNARDDEMANFNCGAFLQAGGRSDPDYFGNILIQNIISDFRQDQTTGVHLNSSSRQYNTMHSYLGQFPDISIQKCDYIAYSDCGLFGNYTHGNPIFSPQICVYSQIILTNFACDINIVELFRARNKIYNQLLQQNQMQTSYEIGEQVHYWNRRVDRTEVANRIAQYNGSVIQNLISRTLWDKDLSLVAWGPLHEHMSNNLVMHRNLRRSTLGNYAQTQMMVF